MQHSKCRHSGHPAAGTALTPLAQSTSGCSVMQPALLLRPEAHHYSAENTLHSTVSSKHTDLALCRLSSSCEHKLGKWCSSGAAGACLPLPALRCAVVPLARQDLLCATISAVCGLVILKQSVWGFGDPTCVQGISLPDWHAVIPERGCTRLCSAGGLAGAARFICIRAASSRARAAGSEGAARLSRIRHAN